MSPYLHSGELSPRRLWHTVRAATRRPKTGPPRKAAEGYLRELIWREFAYHLLFHFPKTISEPLNPGFAKFAWRKDAGGLKAWHAGQTGYPIVDAGMRQLWTTGWMHNRVRMIVGSFLVKDLLLPWQEGAKWFWDTLVDADLANNTLGWQWVAGCGADAAPFFRIFNPIRQGEQFDSEGTYVRQWVPELSKLPDRWIHKPWQAAESVLQDAGIKLGTTYPQPIVDHDAGPRLRVGEVQETPRNSRIKPVGERLDRRCPACKNPSGCKSNRGGSSVGRALRSQCRGRGFNSLPLHLLKPVDTTCQRVFSLAANRRPRIRVISIDTFER